MHLKSTILQTYAGIRTSKKTTIPIVALLLILTFSGTSYAQERTDFGIWAGLSVDQKIVKNFSASFKGQIRLNGNASYFKSTFANIGLNYKLHKLFSVTAGYRYSITPQRNKHRAYLDAKLSYKLKDLGLKFKLRLRGQYDTSSDYTEFPSVIVRPRLYVGFGPKGDLGKKFEFYLTGELFYEFIQSYNNFSKWRFSAGVNYKVSKNTSLNLRYILQDDLNVKIPVMEHILFLGVSVDLPDFKNKKKKKKKKKKD